MLQVKRWIARSRQERHCRSSIFREGQHLSPKSRCPILTNLGLRAAYHETMPPYASAPLSAPTGLSLDRAACYRVLQARDARFDGHFLTGVRTTGNYCRPVCKVRVPMEKNCAFFALAAQAEAAGFRPCLRCRPELAPATPGLFHWSLQDAGAVLVRQALQLLETSTDSTNAAWTVGTWAARLGVSERHLRRLMEEHLHIAPLQVLQTRRLLQAKQCLSDTQWPISEVARLSGFGSVRRFNAVFAKHYRLTPGVMRRTLTNTNPSAAGQSHPLAAGLTVMLPFRPPLDANHLLGFLSQRALPGVEVVDTAQLRYARTLRVGQGAQAHEGWMMAQFQPDSASVRLQLSHSLSSSLLEVQALCRQLLDLDADPMRYEPLLEKSFPNTSGMRLPGTVDGFELAVRAILGQQITVAAARTLSARLVAACGRAIPKRAITPIGGLSHFFPDAATMVQVPASALGALGIVRQRQAAIIGLAGAVVQGQLDLRPGAPVEQTIQQLQSINGIGPWTAQYIAMRALRWPDAFPTGDIALHKALGLMHQANAKALAQTASQAWRPWRSYATIRAWQRASAMGNSQS